MTRPTAGKYWISKLSLFIFGLKEIRHLDTLAVGYCQSLQLI